MSKSVQFYTEVCDKPWERHESWGSSYPFSRDLDDGKGNEELEVSTYLSRGPTMSASFVAIVLQ